MDLHWRKQLGIPLNATTDSIRVDTETKILEQENEFKDSFYHNIEFKKPVNENQPEKNTNIIQQKGRPITFHLQNQVAEEMKRLKTAIWKEQQKQEKIAS